MKTAKEMFEELDFRVVRDIKNCLTYDLFVSAKNKESHYVITSIEFEKNIKRINLTGDYDSSIQVSNELFKAIAKQVEELGWNE